MSDSLPLLLCRKDAAQTLSISLSTLDVLIAHGRLRIRRMGTRVLISRSELERFAKSDQSALWPKKENGKTVRTSKAANATAA